MGTKEIFAFLNSPFWIEHTHQQYRTPDDIYYRLKQKGGIENWDEIKTELIVHRKITAIPLFINSIGKKFWFYPCDAIIKKSGELEKLGSELHRKITDNSNFENDFFRDALVEEAITSAIYEGANSTRAKAKELIESGKTPRSKDEWMLINNYQAMKWIKDNRHRKITLDLVEELHSIVTQNTLEGDDANFCGRFRDDTVFVRSTLGEIKHEGLEHGKITEALQEVLELTTQHNRYFHKMIRGILLHYFIAYIHPFFDGNGRTARALFYFKSMKNDLNFIELLSISAYLKSHGRQYENSFEKVVNNDLDITYFIDFNLDALLKAVKVVERKVNYLLSIGKLKDSFGISDNQIGLMQKLALNKFRKISIEEYATSIEKSREVARQELKKLCELQLLKEHKQGKKFVYQVLSDELNTQIRG